ncbi:MAG: hypothetical protein U0J70_00605, partial [Atopobiaceae bacterium]|nr:hypothetical protein [Atopobiaceae bacterium]
MRLEQEALPLGRCVPRGRVRWYLARCPKGQERSTCNKVRQCVSPELLEDAFVPRTERIKKVHGEWTRPVRDLFEGHFIVATKDAPALGHALAKLTFPVQLVGAIGHGFAPVDKDAQAFLESCMDGSHTIRSSEGEIVSDKLRVTIGPL